MKFTFYIGGKKKKQQVIKVKTNEDLMIIAKIVKCELTKNSILKDLDFSENGKLMCIVKDKEFTMKELWAYLESKLKVNNDNSKNVKKDKKKDKKKKKSSVSGKKIKKESKSKKKDKKKKVKKKDSKVKVQTKNETKKSNGLVHITRR